MYTQLKEYMVRNEDVEYSFPVKSQILFSGSREELKQVVANRFAFPIGLKNKTKNFVENDEFLLSEKFGQFPFDFL